MPARNRNKRSRSLPRRNSARCGSYACSVLPCCFFSCLSLDALRSRRSLADPPHPLHPSRLEQSSTSAESPSGTEPPRSVWLTESPNGAHRRPTPCPKPPSSQQQRFAGVPLPSPPSRQGTPLQSPPHNVVSVAKCRVASRRVVSSRLVSSPRPGRQVFGGGVSIFTRPGESQSKVLYRRRTLTQASLF